jgi:hypothetical protein
MYCLYTIFLIFRHDRRCKFIANQAGLRAAEERRNKKRLHWKDINKKCSQKPRMYQALEKK